MLLKQPMKLKPILQLKILAKATMKLHFICPPDKSGGN